MTLQTELSLRSGTITEQERQRIDHQLASLGKRLQKFPDPRAEVAIESNARRWEVDLRVALGPLGGHLVSHESAETVDLAVKQAVDDVKKQLERRLSNQRGEPSYGVPSRRLPESLRPSSQASDTGEIDEASDEE